MGLYFGDKIYFYAQVEYSDPPVFGHSRTSLDSILNTFPNIPDLQRTYITIWALGELLDIGEKAEVLEIITNIENEYNFSMGNLAKSIEEMKSSNQSTISIDKIK